ncbi:AKR_collapsed_G0005610.mRNA.1.CDS.1 [Saccharomyces cerevisiae]|nr:AKR_collapsed_G0005610.mRNA.1.CDS.1 [Saccharomyces cerevisiae]
MKRLRRQGSKRPKTKMVRLLSDDEYEDDNNNDSTNNDKIKTGRTRNSPKKRREDKSKGI